MTKRPKTQEKMKALITYKMKYELIVCYEVLFRQ